MPGPGGHPSGSRRAGGPGRRDLGQAGLREELALVGREDLAEECPCDPQQVGHLWVRQSVVHLIAASVGLHQQVAPQHGEVLRQVRGFEAGGLEQLGDGYLGR